MNKYLIALVLACWAVPLQAEYETQKLVSGLLIPWGMTFADDNTLLVTERNGHIVAVNLNTGRTTQLMENPEDLYASGQGGLLDIIMSPFSPGWVYVTYSKITATGSDTALATFYFSDNKLTQFQTIFVATSGSSVSYTHLTLPTKRIV